MADQNRSPQPASQTTFYTILVVEDDRDLNNAYDVILTNEGHHVATAFDGKQALNKAKAFKADLILLDLLMPVMGGLDATRAVRKEFQLRQPIIVALTGDMVSGVKENCRECGMDDFLSKPVSLDDLKGVIIRNLTGTATTKVL